jgi:hypothetical protein
MARRSSCGCGQDHAGRRRRAGTHRVDRRRARAVRASCATQAQSSPRRHAFDDLFYVAAALHGRKIAGNRLGAISGAGFEAVSMADSIESDTFSMQMGALEPGTVKRVDAILAAKRLDALVEVNNPNHVDHLRAPTTGRASRSRKPSSGSQRGYRGRRARFALGARAPESKLGRDSTSGSKSTVHLVRRSLSATTSHRHRGCGQAPRRDVRRLMDQGVCIFRNCARGTKALVRYVEARLYANTLRDRS